MSDHRRLRVLSVTIALVLAACGRGGGARGGGSAPAGPDLSTPEVVLVEAHRALSAGDLAGLRPLLTEAGYLRVTRDLEAWRGYLVDPSTGPRAASRLPPTEDPKEREALRAALAGGDPSALLRWLVRADPRLPLPPPAPVARDASVSEVTLLYPARDGESRRVVLVRGAGGWRIDRLQL